ncbi:MAG: acyl-CoA dehydrogenase family protein [Caldilineae bacterium]|nr:acyl-CoA dehydrogenase family protein [Chloroflexota bacterium]MCB9176794.1 acyl-CoA dehydrogenase family protein [Caldilineae bacterium]
MNFELSEEQRQIRDVIREVAQGEFAPRASAIDEAGRFPSENVERLVELGFMGLPIPERYGGAGGDTVSYALAVEEIAAACGSTGLIYAAHVSLGASPFYLFGSEAQKQKYLPRLCNGGLGAFGLTEPHTGSDAGNTKTVAEKHGDRWVLNGQKMWITNGALADTVICTARTVIDGQDRGVSCFIVEKDMPGFTPGANEKKMGLKGSVTSQLFLSDCELPEENLLGEVGKGLRQMLVILDGGRISIAAMALGLGRAALEASVKYSHEREAFGKTIAHFQAIQFKLADMATGLDAARLMIYKAAAMKDAGQRFTTEAAMAKLFASEAAEKSCFEAIQIHGGMGYSRELPVERYYRDNRLTEIGEGTSEILRYVIARNVI